MDKEMVRLQRIYQLLEEDEACRKMKTECETSQKQFESFAEKLPKETRALIWGYPGALYFLHHWTLRMICRHMRFPDETE